MTTFDDFDRRLAQFLDEGPSRSPDRPVDSAIAHALAHPRRRDPFAPLRRDVMARPTMWSTRPVLVFAVLGLLLVVSGAAIFVGSRGQPSVQPPPTLAPSPSPASSPSPTAGSTRGEFTTETIDGLGRTKTVTVIDESGLVLGAVGWEGDANGPAAEIEVLQLPADEGGGMDGIIVKWAALPCSDDFVVTVDGSGRRITVESAPCDGDTLPVDYGVWLRFSESAPADEFTAELIAP